GQFTFYAGTHPDSAGDVLEAFHEEARRLREDGLTPDEFERARNRLKGQQRQQRQSAGARAIQAGLNVLYDLPLNDWKDYDVRLDALSVDDVRLYAASQFRPEHAVSLVLGPKAPVGS
ncbi:MAG: M16 family metallopeptidase, partial [Opitutales bacterium]